MMLRTVKHAYLQFSSADVPCASAEAWRAEATVRTMQSVAAGTSEVLSVYIIHTYAGHVQRGA